MKASELLVRNSERSMFTKCRQSWDWAYRQRLTPKKKAVPLDFGDLVHRALAEYYVPETRKKRRRGPHPAGTFVKLYDAMERTYNIKVEEDERWVAARDLGEEMMTNYIDEYGKDEEILVVYPEMPFSIKIYDSRDRLVGTHTGVSDMLAIHLTRKKFILVEHKTAAAITIDHLFMDEQANTYWSLVPAWLLENEIIDDESELSGMLYNFLRKATRDTRPKNARGQSLNKPSKDALLGYVAHNIPDAVVKGATVEVLMEMIRQSGYDPLLLGEPSMNQPAPLFHREMVNRGAHERQATFDRIATQMTEILAAHNGKLPIYKAPSKDCAWCPFKDMCELHEIGADWEELRDLTFVQWSPYEQHAFGLDIEEKAIITKKKGAARF